MPEITPQLRQLAKAAFYGLCYGMGLQQLGSLLAENADSRLGLSPAKLKEDFVRRFPRLTEYRERLAAESR